MSVCYSLCRGWEICQVQYLIDNYASIKVRVHACVCGCVQPSAHPLLLAGRCWSNWSKRKQLLPLLNDNFSSKSQKDYHVNTSEIYFKDSLFASSLYISQTSYISAALPQEQGSDHMILLQLCNDKWYPGSTVLYLKAKSLFSKVGSLLWHKKHEMWMCVHFLIKLPNL